MTYLIRNSFRIFLVADRERSFPIPFASKDLTERGRGSFDPYPGGLGTVPRSSASRLALS